MFTFFLFWSFLLFFFLSSFTGGGTSSSPLTSALPYPRPPSHLVIFTCDMSSCFVILHSAASTHAQHGSYEDRLNPSTRGLTLGAHTRTFYS